MGEFPLQYFNERNQIGPMKCRKMAVPVCVFHNVEYAISFSLIYCLKVDNAYYSSCCKKWKHLDSQKSLFDKHLLSWHELRDEGDGFCEHCYESFKNFR